MATMTMDEYRRAVARFRDVVEVAQPVMLATIRRTRVKTRKALQQTQLGQALKRAKGKKKIPVTVSRAKVSSSKSENALEASFVVKGMSALIDQGGRTDPHEIRSSLFALVFPGTNAFSGALIQKRSVNHPGSIVRKENVVEPTVEGELPQYQADLAAAMTAHANRSFR